jgi:hypothetical protein
VARILSANDHPYLNCLAALRVKSVVAVQDFIETGPVLHDADRRQTARPRSGISGNGRRRKQRRKEPLAPDEGFRQCGFIRTRNVDAANF